MTGADTQQLAAEQKKSVAEVAASYVARAYAGDMSEAEEKALFDWLAQSPEHEAEYRKLLAMWGRLGELGENSTLINSTTGIGRREPSMRMVLSMAASLLLAIGLGFSWVGGYWSGQGSSLEAAQPYIVHTTAVGEQKAIRLPDGSIVHLNTDSMVQVRDTDKARQVILDKGEAFFDVRKSTRPFSVRVDDELITVLGTRFNVFKKPDALTVAVVEGAVALQPEDLKEKPYQVLAGSMISVDKNKSADRVVIAKLQASQAYRPWHLGRVAFNNTALHDVVDEANRYTTKPITIADAGIVNMPISGVLHLSDVEQALEALEAVFLIRVTATDDKIVIRQR